MNLPTFGWLYESLHASPATVIDPIEEIGTISIDSRTLHAGDVFWALKAQRDGHSFVNSAFMNGARAAFVRQEWKESAAPDVRDRLIGIADTTRDLQKAASRWRATLACPVIGITGTNGKTSTKDLTRRLLAIKGKTTGTEGNFNNEIGVPLTVLGIPRDADYAVVEMGASHRGDIRFLCEIAKPTHGLVTSIGKAHLAGFGNLETVADTKGELYDFVAEHGIAFVPTDEKLCREKSLRCLRKIGFGFQPTDKYWDGEFHRGVNLTFDNHGCGNFCFNGVDIRLSVPGKPAAQTALAALVIADHFGIAPDSCRGAILKWAGVQGRTYVEKIGSMLLMDDSYNANPDSMRAALETLSLLPGPRKTFVCGDMNELGDPAADEHRSLARQLPNWGVTLAIFIGTFAKLSATEASLYGVEAKAFDDCRGALDEIAAIFRSDDVVLVKGSRSLRLEQIVDQLKRLFG